jgi:hypothetical protein
VFSVDKSFLEAASPSDNDLSSKTAQFIGGDDFAYVVNLIANSVWSE